MGTGGAWCEVRVTGACGVGDTTRRKCPCICDPLVQGIMVSRALGLSFSSVTLDPGLEETWDRSSWLAHRLLSTSLLTVG